MKVIFNESGTKENLMRAFAGECQARHRYYFAALTAQEQNLVGLERMFRFTAEQEERHAKQFYELLKEATGTEVNITADYPVNVYTELQKLLDAAAKNENSESSEIYPRFAQIAAQEGYPEIQQKFSMNCGHIHTGSEPPQHCPVCGAAQGYFIREEEAPFTSPCISRVL